MSEKVLLVLVDGMRPDGIEACSHPFLRELRKESSGSMAATTVMPSVTLPCHCSLFFSVDPERHGITTNTWVPQVRPIDSIMDAAAKAGKRCAMFYNWEELRDLNRPGSLICSYYENHDLYGGNASDCRVTDGAIDCLLHENPDLIFLYLGHTDGAGHEFGWMTEQYLDTLSNASACIEKIYRALPEGWSMIVTADHGGHQRSHGCDIPEDITIPIFFNGPTFRKGAEIDGLNIKDIAPTIARLMGFQKPGEWEGISR